jgi:hypothetical protein
MKENGLLRRGKSPNCSTSDLSKFGIANVCHSIRSEMDRKPLQARHDSFQSPPGSPRGGIEGACSANVRFQDVGQRAARAKLGALLAPNEVSGRLYM